jgi:hypothetical protein
VPVRLIGGQVRVLLHANDLVIFDSHQQVARPDRLTRRLEAHLEHRRPEPSGALRARQNEHRRQRPIRESAVSRSVLTLAARVSSGIVAPQQLPSDRSFGKEAKRC